MQKTKVEHYMFSIYDNKNCRWVRNPFTTLTELKPWLKELSKNSSMYSNLQITEEESLDLIVKLPSKLSDSEEVVTLRQVFYGDNYEQIAQAFKDPEKLQSYKESLV
jgi:hypothetical protein